ncbi:MAG: prepilin-type N-terminal cleavage/methylation domain-containing protein [Nitrospira sp.]|nr:prepilin-type N-terminal cleavage/methylation domain-containing protein [Nitrospira sp.]
MMNTTRVWANPLVRKRADTRLGSAGVSLLELLIALAISSVGISAAIQAFAAYGLRLGQQHVAMIGNQELRLGMDVLCSELRLATGGLLGGEAPFLKAEANEAEFFANLSSSATTLTQSAVPGLQDLQVDDGTDWPRGKQVVLCSATRCMWNQLAVDGRSHTLTLATPPTEQFQIRSAVFLLNRVRYYVKPQGEGTLRLMREVDGGVSTLLSDVRRFQLRYFNRLGNVTDDAREVVRVQVRIEVGTQGLVLSRDIAIRT